MTLTIRQKADRIGGFRYVAVYAMETLARWVPTTAELEAKVLFGRHVWVFAQHADQLGRRTGELRAPLQYSHPPTESFQGVLEAMDAVEGTGERIEGFYDAFLPDLERRYRAHVGAIDAIDDEPSLRIIERILFDLERVKSERAELAEERPDLATGDGAWAGRLREMLAAEDAIIAERPEPPRAQNA